MPVSDRYCLPPKGALTFRGTRAGRIDRGSANKGGGDFFQERIGARSFLDIPKEAGQYYFSRGNKGEHFFWAEKGSGLFLFIRKSASGSISGNGNGI